MANERCKFCNESGASIEIYDGGESTGELICRDCLHTDIGYITCLFCGDDIAHPEDQVNNNSECKAVHAGESCMSEDEKKGWESNIRKWSEE
jgi:hypothetical protein